MKKYKMTVFAGRFQPFHNAHLDLVIKASKLSNKIIIAIGSSNKPRSIKNPFTFEERSEMIARAIDKEIDSSVEVIFVPIRDYIYNDTQWATELYSKALSYGATSDKETALLGCFKDESSFYLNMFPQWSLVTAKVGKVNHKVINATDIRDVYFSDCRLGTSLLPIPPEVESYLIDFSMQKATAGDVNHYQKLINEFHFLVDYKKRWEAAPFAPTFVTVDSVVIKSGHVLLVERGGNPGIGQYALPGGFLNQNEKLIDGAVRELFEETEFHIRAEDVSDSKVFDHPNRSLRGRTLTHAFLFNLGIGPLPTVIGSDDAKKAFWLPFADLNKHENNFFEDHLDIINYLTRKF